MGKRKMLARLYAILLVVLISSTFTVGCGNKTTNTENATTVAANTQTGSTGNGEMPWKSDKPLEVSIMYQDTAQYPFNNDWPTLKEIRKLANVSLKFDVVPSSDYLTKVRVTLNSGQSPDVIMDVKSSDLADYASNGSLLSISDNMDLLPNFKKTIDDWQLQPDLNDLTMLDNKLYEFPRFQEQFVQTRGLVIRTDLLKKYNLPTPTTYDELYNVFKKLKEVYPNSYPFTNEKQDANFLDSIAPSFGTVGGTSCPTGMYYNKAEDKWEHAYTSDSYKNLLKYLNKLISEKLLDPEAFTQNDSQAMKKLTTGVSFAAYVWGGQIAEELNGPGRKISGDNNFNFWYLEPLKATGSQGYSAPGTRYLNGTVIPASITKKSNYKQILQFMDWFYYSDQASTLFTWGVEGLSYKVVDGKKQYMDNVSQVYPDTGTLSLWKDVGCYNNDFSFKMPLDWMLASGTKDRSEYSKNLIDKGLIPPTNPNLKLTPDQQEQHKLMYVPLNDYCKSTIMKFIFGELSIDKDWDKYVSECDKLKRQELVKFYNDAWKNQNKK